MQVDESAQAEVPDPDDDPDIDECCSYCGKPFQEFGDLGCEYCDRRHPAFGVLPRR
jgi:hypothetical protein